MSLAFLPNSAVLSKLDIKDILLFLYKLSKLGKNAEQYTEYNYNYNYVPPLAMTGAVPLPLIKLGIPVQELPNLKWVVIVAAKITTLLVNEALSNFFDNSLGNSLAYGLEGERPSLELTKKLQTLVEIDKEIQESDSKHELEKLALKLALTTREIITELKSNDLGNVSFDVNETSEVAQELAEIDQEWELYEAEQKATNVDFSSSVIEDAIADLLSGAVKQVILANADLLKFDDDEALPGDVNFSPEVSAAQRTLKDYNKLFSIIPLPQISQNFSEDLTFGYMRVAGPNPLMLQQVKAGDKILEISDALYQEITKTSDSLAAAISEGRLYQADYAALKDMQSGNFPQEQKYIYAPVALFVVPPLNNLFRPLIPIAIQCQSGSPVFTPLSGENWLVAKSVVQMADVNYHELVSHLGRTHLFIEPFAIATRRQLPKNHPLRILLEPHLEGTILINYGAHQKLIADQGGVDKLLASTIESDRQMAIKGAQDYLYNFNAAMFPNILVSRSVDNVNQLPEYPYRDDGQLIWQAVSQWVSTYLSIQYPNAQQIIADVNLQNWAKELVSQQGGRLQNFGEDVSGTIKTLEYLIQVATTVIFTASAQHAAVNFPQGNLMTYTPAFPLAGYSSAPTSDQQSDLMNFLPPLSQAKDQLKLTYLLGSVYYTRLGQYSNSYFHSQPQIKAALFTFQTELKDIEAEINRRNRLNSARIMPYEFLLPSRIPQSINI
ncbi:lipoxygenase [Nostoc spongiaeforme FACHB-130]|uniref:Lipoxygenase n=1 Tax=Nostoc spongiaeforme FACHB-130 TaxID=1357510 RepID=A0ABR8G0Y6_9NOSO|nr:lipoxygenase family protein [Nostoc spongiaeforme]MBD2596876.1 lipoxygenase [Nostoc spongiaeforme FACHB-130]